MLIRQSSIYGAGRLLTAVVGFALISVLTHLLTPEEYGIYSFIIYTVTFAFKVAFMWICTSTIRLFRRYEDHKRLMGALLSIYFAVFAFGLTGGIISLGFIDTSQTRGWVVLSLILFVTTSWLELNLRFLQVKLMPGVYVAATVARSVLTGGLCSLLAWQGFGVDGLVIGTIVATLVPGLAMMVFLWRGVRPNVDRAVLGQIFAFGLPLFGSFGVGALASVSDRYILAGLMGMSALGLYALAFELTNRIMIALTAPIGSASAPLVVKALENEGPDAARVQLTRSIILFLGLTVPAAVGLIGVSEDFVTIAVGGEFKDAAMILVPLMAVTILMREFRAIYLDQAFHLGMKTKRHFIVVVCIVTVNVALNFLFIPMYGLIGAAYAMLTGQIVGNTLSIFIGRGSFRLPFPLLQIGKILLASGVMAAGVFAIPGEPGLVALILKVLAGGAIYVSLVLILDVANVRAYLRQKIPARLLPAGRG